MQGGRIVQIGTPAGDLRRPVHQSIADFLGVGNIFPLHHRRRTAPAHRAPSPRHTGAPPVTEVPATDGPTSLCLRPGGSPGHQAGREAATGPDVWPGRVDVASFQGATVRYRVTLEDGPDRRGHRHAAGRDLASARPHWSGRPDPRRSSATTPHPPSDGRRSRGGGRMSTPDRPAATPPAAAAVHPTHLSPDRPSSGSCRRSSAGLLALLVFSPCLHSLAAFTTTSPGPGSLGRVRPSPSPSSVLFTSRRRRRC